MADTQRTVAALQAILADNVTGDISAQDVRDMLVSLAPDHGEMYISTSAATTVSVKDTWYPISGTWALTGGAKNFSAGASGLQFDGDEARLFRLAGTGSFTGGTGDTLEFAFAKNGTVITPSIIRRKLGSSDVGAAAIVSHATLDTGDQVSVYGRNTTDTSDFTCLLGVIDVLGIPA